MRGRAGEWTELGWRCRGGVAKTTAGGLPVSARARRPTAGDFALVAVRAFDCHGAHAVRLTNGWAARLAAVGARTGHTVRTHPHTEVDRAVTAGFSCLVLDRRGRLIGATVVGPRAGDALAELTLTIRRGLRARDLAATMHPYPAYGDGPWNVAIGDVRSGLGRGPTRIAVRALAARRHRWVGRPGVTLS